MNTIIKFFIAIGIIFSVFACKKYVPIYGDQEIEALGAYYNGQVLFLNNDSLFIATDYLIMARSISSPAGPKSMIRRNAALDKIAYLNAAGHPVIIDTFGTVIATLTQYSDIKSMDWHGDNTLYMLSGNNLYFYGDLIEVAANPFYPLHELTNISDTAIKSMAILGNGDILSSYQYKTGNLMTYGLTYAYKDGRLFHTTTGVENEECLNLRFLPSTGNQVSSDASIIRKINASDSLVIDYFDFYTTDIIDVSYAVSPYRPLLLEASNTYIRISYSNVLTLNPSWSPYPIEVELK